MDFTDKFILQHLHSEKNNNKENSWSGNQVGCLIGEQELPPFLV